MANPAPTINQINAFNATQGTVIDFNIIGGTELVRSNKIYIYDLSDNSLICTHLYPSTESIHELPANDDASMVYASGKSSADFVNNKQYYAQIQTFTNTAGTQGGSGLSVAKLFWCLPSPSLSFETIPATISTTSYNATAIYDSNITSQSVTVPNIVQQYQFDLYNAVGTLVESSGVIVGSGTQVNTSTQWGLSYNFSGLVVDTSYYFKVSVTTTEGMSLIAQSSTFKVDIATPTMDKASVANDACNGYISVTSNLSEDYEHTVSGEGIVTFETDSVNTVSSLTVDMEPQQDGTPWVATTEDTAPYLFRQTGNGQIGHSANSEYNTLVGGSFVWNQLVENGNFADISDWTAGTGVNFSASNNIGLITIDNTQNTRPNIIPPTMASPIEGHKYLVTLGIKVTTSTTFTMKPRILYGGDIYINGSFGISKNEWNNLATIFVCPSPIERTNATIYMSDSQIAYNSGDTIEYRNYQIIDLTAYASSIADYAYTLEQQTAGSGIAWLKANCPQLFKYHDYSAPTMQSVEATAHVTRGFNQWDEEWEQGSINANTGQNTSGNTIRSKNYIPVVPSQNYYCNVQVLGIWYDADKNYIGYVSNGSALNAMQAPTNGYYFRFRTDTSYGTTYNNDICINISDPSRNGEYEPYTEHSYPLGNVTLRGVLMVVNGQIKYDGDIYTSDGMVTRKYGIVDLGTLNWRRYMDSGGYFGVTPSDLTPSAKPCPANMTANIVVSKDYTPYDTNHVYGSSAVNMSVGIHSNGALILQNTSYSDATALKTSLDGVYLVYELATPTTEQADPFQSPQVCDPNGTEAYTTTNDVPVGQSTTYADIYEISGTDEVEAYVRGVNWWDEEWELGLIVWQTGQNSSYSTRIRSKNYIDALPSTTYYLLSQNNAVDVFYYDKNKTHISSKYMSGNGTFTTPSSAYYIRFCPYATYGTTYNNDISINYPSTDHDYHPYQGADYTQALGRTVYGGTVDLVSGVLRIDKVMTNMGALNWSYSSDNHFMYVSISNKANGTTNVVSSLYPYGNVFAQSSDMCVCGNSVNNTVYVKNTAYINSTEFKQAMNGVQLVYELAEPVIVQLTPQEITTVAGTNNVWTSAGNVALTFHIPITQLLVKRKDMGDVSGGWLTLYAQPITDADDMDFTYIDFLNQYGKTYKYALVPVLAQQQGDTIVEIEGGYTLSDSVLSQFDYTFIMDKTGSERVKANVGYSSVGMNQSVGSILPIGAKYPVIITNSHNQYESGSISGKVLPDDFYTNGNLSRVGIVAKRDEFNKFLTNKKVKIIKDWNGNMWMVMILDNIDYSFDDNYGMGIVGFTANWVEVGDATNQEDLQATGLIDVGGV